MTDKIPPRPATQIHKAHLYCTDRELIEYLVKWRDYYEAVAKVAVEALENTPCTCHEVQHKEFTADGMKHLTVEDVTCPSCEALREIKESGWTP